MVRFSAGMDHALKRHRSILIHFYHESVFSKSKRHCMKIKILFAWLFMCMFPILLMGQKTGLVLSGGGVRGMAHIGVLKALEENGIPIDYITGTSAGAVVGSLYSIGLSPKQIETLVLSGEFREWATGQINEDLDYFYNKREETAS